MAPSPHRRLIALIALALLGLMVVPAGTASAAGGKCFGKQATIKGTGGTDRIQGMGKKDVIVTGGGNDVVNGRGGVDLICTGGGKDKAKGGGATDALDGGGGRDRLVGAGAADLCLRGERLKSCENAEALHLADGFDWGFTQNAAGHEPATGDTITETLRIGNGIPGAQGYSMTSTSPEGFLAGATTVLTFTGNDDATTEATLPFPVPFGGVTYGSVQVSTNGWAQFGEPAWDYFADWFPPAGDVAEYYRGVMPYFADLMLDTVATDPGDAPGVVRIVTAADGQSFAIQWVDVAQYNRDPPERDLQVVFFRDGRIRYDYPGPNAPGGTPDNPENLVALSTGTGPADYIEVARNNLAVPGSSLLFVPKKIVKVPIPAGTMTASVPAGTTFGSASPGCSLTTTPTASADGLVTCAVPKLAKGGQAQFEITWGTSADEVDYNVSAEYRFGGVSLTERDQLLDDTH
ncbi:MAG TPA: hypothetical protein VE737_08510 [Actinomycetota bacterium]|jgi:hypothetical protein|nr:hypothetical protein [Actinomycetota bacterium]